MKQLSEMYNTSRQTIYEKTKHPDLQQYLIIDEKGKKLLPEGLNILNLLMADSRVKLNADKENDGSMNPYMDKYIDELNRQITELKKDKERLQATVNDLITNQRILLEPPKKESLFARLFKK